MFYNNIMYNNKIFFSLANFIKIVTSNAYKKCDYTQYWYLKFHSEQLMERFAVDFLASILQKKSYKHNKLKKIRKF